MFFIGVFGIEHREKIIKEINNLTCKKCLQNVTGKLIKEYDYFHFFFIPIFKWHEEYYLLCENCNRVFKVSEEKGKSIENGNDININYWDLKEEGNIYGGKKYAQIVEERLIHSIVIVHIVAIKLNKIL